jgi:hypothetical protein
MSSNEHPDMSGSGCDDDGLFTEDRMADAFRAGAAQMREMLARFVEHGPASDPKTIAESMRLNWVPNWGKDPGKQDDVHDDLWSSI